MPVYYLCSKNKGADQLCCYCEADLRLFSHMQNVGFLKTQLLYYPSSEQGRGWSACADAQLICTIIVHIMQKQVFNGVVPSSIVICPFPKAADRLMANIADLDQIVYSALSSRRNKVCI